MVNTPLPPSQPATLQAAGAAYSGDRYGNTNASPPPPNTLHSIRKPPAKPWKRPAAGPPIPPKVYRVEPRGFRQLVQKLTGRPELAPRRLRDTAPVPLDVTPLRHAPPPRTIAVPPPPPPSTSEYARGFSTAEAAAAADAGYQSQAYTAGIPSPSMYSACLTWCNQPLLSPGSMASLGQSTVL
uniref:VQ domain-containing protein n=1 Tax=Anthurium amnicola TaxID=1678845 RepID=A0A1D1Z6U4_9ARAE